MSQIPSTILSSFSSASNTNKSALNSFSMGFKSSGFQGLSLPIHSISLGNGNNNTSSSQQQTPTSDSPSGSDSSRKERTHHHHHHHHQRQNSSSGEMDQQFSARSRTSSASGLHTPTFDSPESFGFTERTINHSGTKRASISTGFIQSTLTDQQESGDELEILKRQLEQTKDRYETFRKGFLLERNQRLKTVHDLYKFTKKMEILQKQLFEKDTALLALSTENVKLKEDIYEIHKFGAGSSQNTASQPSSQPASANKDNQSDSGSKRRFLFSKKRNMSSDSSDGTKNPLPNENLKQVVNMDYADRTDSPKPTNESKLDAIQEMKHWRELYRKTQNDLKKREKQISDLQSQEHVQKQMLQEIQAKYRNTEGTLSKCQETITSLKTELFEREQSNLNTIKENDSLQQQLGEYQKWKEEFLENYKEMEQAASGLKSEVERKDLDLLRLTEKCMELKEQLNSVRLQIRKFRCKRISQGGLANKLMGSVNKSDAAIVLHKNPQNGILWIDIKIRNGKDHDRDFNNINSNIVQSHPLSSITDIVPDVHDSKRFSIYFFSNVTASPSKNSPTSVIETFECTSESERTETMQNIQEFISIAAQAYE